MKILIMIVASLIIPIILLIISARLHEAKEGSIDRNGYDYRTFEHCGICILIAFVISSAISYFAFSFFENFFLKEGNIIFLFVLQGILFYIVYTIASHKRTN